MQLSNVKGMRVSSWRFTTSLGGTLGKSTHQWGAGQCGGGVRPWLPTGKVWWGDDSSITGLWVRGDGRRSSSGIHVKLLASLHRDLQQNHDTVDSMTWAEMSKHSSMALVRTTIQTDAATQPMWGKAVFRGLLITFIPLWVERYAWQFIASVWFLVVVIFGYRGTPFSSPREKCLPKWTWDSIVSYMHIAVAMLPRKRCCISLTVVPCARTKCSSSGRDEHTQNIV